MRYFFFFLFLLSPLVLRAQDLGSEVPHDTLIHYGIYDFDRLPPSFHADRRADLLDSMAPHSVAVFLASEETIRSNDDNYQYHQDPNFYYLTGCIEPGSALLLSKDGIEMDGHAVHAILFVLPRDPSRETWTGRRLGPQGAMSVLRFEAARPIADLGSILSHAIESSTMLYYGMEAENRGDHAADSTVRAARGNLELNRSLLHVLAELREVKQSEELRLMRKAISISNEAHNAVLHDARPGWYEYQIQAEAEDIFTKNGAEYVAYPCIVGSGPNSTILHYETNRRKTEPGDFIEMDMGGEYHGYAADITRSFPISGTFTPEQRAIYALVFQAQDSGIRACKMGAPFRSAHYAAVHIIANGLVKLGILKDTTDYRTYFMHGTSHYLGLDVHDAGTYGPLEPGNVLTVEPGIYIAAGSPCDPKWWNIGCRIEDDILVTDRGPEILSRASPRSIEDLERLLKR
ncbi:MAG TPA: aminopeptidase P N-terminal domain-containing protein [Candidatus Kapabacteria bacterium]|jgi:Xaa-Pro aminopeptidase